MSKKYCCVPGCADSGDSHPVLHMFPNPEMHPDRFRSWVHAIGGDILGLDDKWIYKNRRVCRQHFEERHCNFPNRLNQLAIPTKKLPGPSTIHKFSFSGQRYLRDIQNIDEMDKPSTSKAPFGLFGMNINVENQEGAPKTLTITEKFDKENIRHIEDFSCERKVSDVPFPRPTSVLLPESVLEKCNITISNLSSGGPSTAIQHSLEKTEIDKKTIATPRAYIKKRGCRLTKNEHNLYLKLLRVRNKLSKVQNKKKQQAASIKAARKLTSNTAFLSVLESFSSSAKILTMMQFREYKKKNKGRRFTLQEKILALTIFKQTPKGYRYLRKIYILPAPQTLTKLISDANLKPGINKSIVLQLKKVAGKMKMEDRLCVLMFDEMYLKANIAYNERKDRLSGFVCDGMHSTNDFADHAQVFMIRGLMKNYKQPVSYTFSATSTKAQELAVQIKDTSKTLLEAGFVVVAMICDQGSNNRSAIRMLLQETRAYYLRKGLEPNDRVIVINDHEIIPLYDPPHLLKCLRNNLLTKDLKYTQNNKEKTAKWEHIKLLHRENPGYKGVRLIPKITDCHVLPQKISKMKVKYASQIFSRTVASNMGYLAAKGILPKECQETADLIIFLDEMFDSCNGSYQKRDKSYGKPLLGPVTTKSIHHKVWLEGKKMFKNMKFVHPSTSKVENVPSLHNWAWTLDGFEILFNKISIDYGITSLWMRHLNQDPIENFFGAIRSHGCRNTNPTCDRFEGAFATLLINNMSSVHAPGNNCENDFCENLNILLLNEDKDCKPATTVNLSTIEIRDFSQKTDTKIVAVLQYVSGYFVKNCKRKIFKNCEICKTNLISEQGAEYIQYREYKGRQWLCSPTKSVVEMVSDIQEISNFVLKNHINENHVKELIKTYIFMFLTFDFINCPQHKDMVIDFLIKTTTRFFISSYCKDINRILSGKREIYDDEDVIQIKAQKYFKKCSKRPIK